MSAAATRRFYAGTEFLLMAILVCAFSALVLWLLFNGYFNDQTLLRWARVLGVFGAKEVLLENLTLLYPWGPTFAVLPFYYLPGLANSAAPYFASIVFGSLLFVIWNHHLYEDGFNLRRRAILMLLAAAQPSMLWAMTNGDRHSLSLLLFYILYIATQRIIIEHDVRSYMALGLTLAVYFFFDELSLFLFVALIPLIAIMAPRRILLESPASVYMVTMTPFIIAVASWSYLNWLFHGDATAFISSPESSFLGAWQHALELAWLREYGGLWIKPTLVSLGLMLLSYPVMVFLIAINRRNPLRLRASIVLFLHPPIAVGFATSSFFLSHPQEILMLAQAGIMAEIARSSAHERRRFGILCIFLLLGAVGGWHAVFNNPSANMRVWLEALQGHKIQQTAYEEDLALGRWLAQHPGRTLVDHRSAYRAIAARENAQNLLLPFSPEFKHMMKRKELTADYVVVPDPRTHRGRADLINQRFPDLYERGRHGYRLVYDQGGWRVYEKNSA